jgi:hypothetical protein
LQKLSIFAHTKPITASLIPHHSTTNYSHRLIAPSPWYACFSKFSAASSALVIYTIVNQNVISTSFLTAIIVTAPLYNWPVIACPIQVRWRSGDFPTSRSGGTGATSTVSSGSPITGETSVSAQSSSSLSQADIVAIAVAAASIVIVGLALLLWFIRRQRELRHRDTAQQVQY